MINPKCTLCGGTGKEPTDLWAKTTAAWQPCFLCLPTEYEIFLSSDNDAQLNWFREKQINKKPTSTPED